MYRKSRLLHAKKIWLEHTWIGALFVFIIATVLFTLWTAAPTFIDPDSFYHVKITELTMKNRGAVTEFPWLKFTTLSEHYVDHHFLYHVALIPFFLLFGSLVGMKVATVLFAASTVMMFYILLRSQHIRYAIMWTLLLLCSHSFAFRLGLAKAPSVALFGLFLGYYFLLKNNWRGLVGTSFAFVWTYGGFIVLPVVALIHTLISYRSVPKHKHIFMQNIIAVVGGTIAGLLIHPSFPEHLLLYWQQVIQIGVVNYQHVISVGSEWYPYAANELFADYTHVVLLFILALVAFGKAVHKQTNRSKTALIVTLLFILATMKSRRFIEYTLPWSFLFIASSLYDSGALDHVYEWLRSAWKKARTHVFTTSVTVLCSIGVLLTVSSLAISGYQRLVYANESGIPFTKYDAAGEWLRSHANKGDVVFHSDWDEFPILFYQAARGRYIVGLDPTFMYNYSPELYTIWYDITTGAQNKNLFEDISQQFHARLVFVAADNEKMDANIRRDKRFIEVYKDDEVTIYRVPRE